jgi:glycosyltransferase involved in cell wall biosynthesis
MTRVTHVVFDFDGGGLESLVATMATGFLGSPVKVSLVTLSGRLGRLGAATMGRFDDFQIVRPVPVASIALPFGAAQAIRRTRPDVVHLHTGAWLKGVRAARLAGVARVVYTEHGREHYDPLVMRVIDRYASRSTDAVVAVSDRLAAYMAREIHVAPSKVRTIHNGVDTSAFTPGPAGFDFRQALDIPPSAVIIGSVGRLETVKGYDILLDAVAALRHCYQHPFFVVLFGDGSQRSALEAQAARLAIGDIVRFAGWTDQALSAYRSLDLFVLSSRSEGQSVSLLEAMSCGVLPVVTDVGANAEMLGPELGAHVVSAGQPGALAATLREALRQRESWRARSSQVRRRVVESYSLDRMLAGYEQLYRQKPRTVSLT